MSSHAFYIVYDGPALENSQMAVRDLAPALLALSDVFDEANKVLNGDRSEVRLDVKASFKTGCFGIDLIAIQNIKNAITNFFTSTEIQAAVNICEFLGISGGGLIYLLRKIRGRKIEKIEIKEKKATVYVDNEKYETEVEIIDLLRNSRIRQSLEDVIAEPLSKDGINTFGFTQGDPQKRIVSINKDECASFKAPPLEDELISDTEYDTNLQLVGISFQEGNKWRFSDGASIFHAAIKDFDFLGKVNNQAVSFTKGDILFVRVREVQKLSSEGIKSDKEILKVISHRKAVQQLHLPIIQDENG